MSARRRARAWRPALALLLAALAAPLWLPALGLALVTADPLRPADAVAALAGGDARARYAAGLLLAGHARHLVASDLALVAPSGRPASRSNAAIAIAAGAPRSQIAETDRIVRSTYQELQAIRDLALRSGWRSLIVVTSPEHTRRTRLMADEVFRGSGVAAIVRPVIGHGYEPARWWRNGEERRLVALEYLKIARFLVGVR